jgi:Plasmid pRiA4b ORF-3-like protein
VARTHLAITVELVHGVHTEDLWPRPGRMLIAARTATFEQLGKAIDDAFARWDHNHLHEFTLADGTVIIPARWWDGEEPQRSVDGAKARLGRLRPAEQFAYTFDLGDNRQHLCTVAPQRADPLETLGIIPDKPLPCLSSRETGSHAMPTGPKATPISSGPEGSLGHEGGSPMRT